MKNADPVSETVPSQDIFALYEEDDCEPPDSCDTNPDDSAGGGTLASPRQEKPAADRKRS